MMVLWASRCITWRLVTDQVFSAWSSQCKGPHHLLPVTPSALLYQSRVFLKKQWWREILPRGRTWRIFHCPHGLDLDMTWSWTCVQWLTEPWRNRTRRWVTGNREAVCQRSSTADLVLRNQVSEMTYSVDVSQPLSPATLVLVQGVHVSGRNGEERTSHQDKPGYCHSWVLNLPTAETNTDSPPTCHHPL